MVNTFLPYKSFKKTAESLDRARLGKQRVEAYQILNLCVYLRALGDAYNLEFPNTLRSKKEYIKEVHNQFKRENQWVIMSDDGTLRFYEKDDEILCNCEKKDQVKDVLCLTSLEKVVTLGFCKHPMVLAWIGFEDALKEYIDACISAWTSRGYKNNMMTYGVTGATGATRPPWTLRKKYWLNHRSALLKKEIDREEADWYKLNQDFLEAPEFFEYIWPGSDEEILDLED